MSYSCPPRTGKGRAITRTVEGVERGYRVAEWIEPHYAVEEVPYGKVYRWCPGCLVIECRCGEELILPGSERCSGCEADYADIPWEMMVEEPKSGGEPRDMLRGSLTIASGLGRQLLSALASTTTISS